MSLAHGGGGGGGCKLSPAVLRDLFAGMPQAHAFPDLLVGHETADDAAVHRLTDELAPIATTDFFTPVVDDPCEFGRTAPTNALSDVYAMGGTPLLALASPGMPLGKVETATVRRILAGGTAVCQAAGIPVEGGHSIDSAAPIYGLAAPGTVHPDRVLRNGGVREGDALVLTEGLGVGVFGAALKQERLPPRRYRVMIDSATQPNAVGPALAAMDGVHATTGVTGFGSLDHALEVCRDAGLRARIAARDVPILEGAADLARAGFRTGVVARNWASYGAEVGLPAGLPD